MNLLKIKLALLLLISLIFVEVSSANNSESESKSQFEKLEKLNWKEVFFDSGTQDWKQNWFLDGKKATITHSEKGMDFMSGPERKENASHSVLWTKESFQGDIRIDFEYTKIEDVVEAVTILYIQATGSGEEGFEKDIMQWADKRDVPAMSTYYRNMNTYHISYAAFDNGNKNPKKDYIRARRYIPGNIGGLRNTDLKPDYFETGFFKKDETYKITIIKKDDNLFMRIRNGRNEKLCHWKTDEVPSIIEGRIGLRHMWTRGARYKDFKISQIEE